MSIIDQYKPNNVLSTNLEIHILVRLPVRSTSTHRVKFHEDLLEISSEQEIPRFHRLVISPKTVPGDPPYEYLRFDRGYWEAASNSNCASPQVFSRIRLLSEDTTCNSIQNNGERLDVAPQKFKEESK
jgi:hypothetical protein